jgi:hypothetical protein
VKFWKISGFNFLTLFPIVNKLRAKRRATRNEEGAKEDEKEEGKNYEAPGMARTRQVDGKEERKEEPEDDDRTGRDSIESNTNGSNQGTPKDDDSLFPIFEETFEKKND